MRRVFVDTGPIVALLRKREEHHAWAADQFDQLEVAYTCEPVLAEACARIQKLGGNPLDVLAFVEAGALVVEFDLAPNVTAVRTLMHKYRDQPMDLADACLVLMSEQWPDCAVLTLDADFISFRRRGREIIPLIIPPR